MGLFEISIISIGLAMDAFIVSIAQGLCIKKQLLKKAIIVAAFFGIFQALMPVLGYLIGSSFSKYLDSIDHWVAFILLTIIGLKMIHDGNKKDNSIECTYENDNANYIKLFVLAIATSIDALAIGFSFAFLQINILSATLIIGIITFIISFVGVYLGRLFPKKFNEQANLLGGIVLVLIGFKILFEHLSII